MQTVSPLNAHIFPEYILPKVSPFVLSHGQKVEPSALMRMTLASCLDSLATSALQFLDITQALRADGSLPTSDPEAEEEPLTRSIYQELFDTAKEDLVLRFEALSIALATDPDSAVRRAFLGSVASLCVFFGSNKVNDVLLSHLNTYLNDKDWTLKCAFFDTIVGVATYIGGVSLEEFILPLMLQALTDPEEFVVERVLRSFSAMAELGLFQRAKQWELVDIVARFSIHPNGWIREAAAQFIAASTTYLSTADIHCIITPLISPFLRIIPSELSELKILDSLKKPLPRLILDQATSWASTAENSAFWGPARQQRPFILRPSDEVIIPVSTKDLGLKTLNKIPKSSEDEQWLSRLRNAGMTQEDEVKLVALREYIWRVAARKSTSEYKEQQTPSEFNQIVPVNKFGIKPQTVFFEPVNDFSESAKARDMGTERKTLSDALLDASTTVNDSLSRRKLSYENSRLAKADAQRQGSVDSIPASPSSPLRAPSLEVPLSDRRPSRTVRGTESPLEDSPIGSPVSLKPHDPLTQRGRAIRHKGSAISLLGKGDSKGKAAAETSTTSANAFGKVDGGSSRDTSVARRPPRSAQQNERVPKSLLPSRSKAVHDYTGTEPTVLKLLDTLYLDQYPMDNAEFGPPVKPLSGRQPIRGSSQNASSPWRPEGVLVGIMSEHSAAINRIIVAPDHAFFVTGSDDGTAKIWDTTRLERNVTYRSRCTYKLPDGAKVTTLTFVENTHALVVTGSDGSAHVIKIPFNPSHGVPRYGKIQVLREYRLPEGEYATWSEHYKHENQSILVLATSTSRVVFLELRTMTELFQLQNPLHHGTLTSFCIDRKHNWLLLGTSHGVLDLWDLRFRLRLKAWSLHGGSPVHRLTLQRGPNGRKSRVYIAGGTGPGEVTVWDLEKKLCKEVYRTAYAKDTSTTFSLIDIDEDKSLGVLGRFATSLEPNSTSAGLADRGVKAIAIGSYVPSENNGGDYANPTSTSNQAGTGNTDAPGSGYNSKQFFFLSAGPDWKVRFWDCTRFDTAMVVSGRAFDEAQPSHTVSQPAPETIVVQERNATANNGSATASSAGASRTSKSDASKRSSGGGTSTTTTTSKSAIVALQQQHLLKSHLDAILDVALLEYPYGVVVSVDRAGMIYIFQ